MTRIYEPVVRWTLRWKWAVISGAVVMVALSIPVVLHLGSEFMPPLDEGAVLYMPSTMPGISISQAQILLQSTDRILARFPEVDQVLGKARPRRDLDRSGAAVYARDRHHPQAAHSEWRHVDTWYSSWAPEITKPLLRHFYFRYDLRRRTHSPRLDESLKRSGFDEQCLDHAHQGAHRHADHRHAHSGWPENLRRKSGHDFEQIGTRQIESLLPRVKGHARESSPSAPAPDISWISSGTAKNWPTMA